MDSPLATSEAQHVLPLASARDSRESQAARRLHGLDWLRAIATLFVVALHAGIPYMHSPLPGLAWPVHNPESSLLVDGLCWMANGLAMPIFFLMSGFLAAKAAARLGGSQFLKRRLPRLIGPLLFGMLVILPLDLYAWLLGWVNTGEIDPVKLRSLKILPPHSDNLWGLSHLWYLQYLVLFSAAGGAIHAIAGHSSLRRLLGRVDPSENWSKRISHPLALLPCIAISALMLTIQPRIVIGFRHSWWPLTENLLYYAPAFFVGWLWAKESPRAARPRGWWLRLAVSVLAFSFAWPAAGAFTARGGDGGAPLGLAISFAIFTWCGSTGLFGLCLNAIRRPLTPLLRPVLEASFWIYLFHHPVVGLVQGDLHSLPLSPLAKFACTMTVTTVLCLLTYSAFVKGTWVGSILSGRRPALRQNDENAAITLPEAQDARRAA